MKEWKGMRRRYKAFSLMAGIFVTLGIILWSNAPSMAAGKNKVDLTDYVKEVPARPEIYDTEIQRLKMAQCAQCHIAVFSILQKSGARHQLPCEFCHTKYHTLIRVSHEKYSGIDLGKVDYADAVPKCVKCHGTPHGEDEVVKQCSNCHSNAHSPLEIPSITADMCIRCHQGPPNEIAQNVSKHQQVACTDCHIKHGYKPKCAECHSEKGGKPYHLTGVEDSVCLGCHPVHQPLSIKYSEDTPQEYCAPCHKNPSHERVLNEIREANTKHNTEVTCAGCHDEHGKIPDCSKCHEPHVGTQATQDCLHCHQNPHKPLNIVFDGTEDQKWCAPCHEDEYNKLIASQTRHTALPCSKCHDQHGKIPECQKCHGIPHGESIVHRFKTCADCHGSAHDVQGRIKE